MAIDTSQILLGKVMHKRLFPKINAFVYHIYYLVLPLSQIRTLPIPVNRFGLMSFYEKDHGYCDGRSVEDWAREVLKTFNIAEANGEIILVCMPRILGYVFNPVSFYLCHDKEGNLRAVVYEVRNTFGERHTYVCAHEDNRVINKDETIQARKLFHVSPFLEREGHYVFRTDVSKDAMKFYIDFYDEDGRKKLITSLVGQLSPMNKSTCRKVFLSHPLVTLKAIGLIHWQALKLILKGIAYISKPVQKEERVSASDHIKHSSSGSTDT